MSEPLGNASEKPSRPSTPLITLAAAALVLVLALGAVFFPRGDGYDLKGVLLVLDAPSAAGTRQETFTLLAGFLEELSGESLEVKRTSSRSEFLELAEKGVDFLFCPDGLALELGRQQYLPLVAGKRSMPTNLRPRGVLVYRKSLGQQSRPWQSHPQRTIFGDSLSLVALGGLPRSEIDPGCRFGPDPYDHRPALHALRLGGGDFALVRQWDADSFFAAGLLDSAQWGVQNRTVPVPDLVVMASRSIPVVERLKWADSLALVGRSDQPASEGAAALAEGLQSLGLIGFNLLLDPDFELVRRNFPTDWPPQPD